MRLYEEDEGTCVVCGGTVRRGELVVTSTSYTPGLTCRRCYGRNTARRLRGCTITSPDRLKTPSCVGRCVACGREDVRLAAALGVAQLCERCRQRVWRRAVRLRVLRWRAAAEEALRRDVRDDAGGTSGTP